MTIKINTALQLLFDFPANNDMSFLEHGGDVFVCVCVCVIFHLNGSMNSGLLLALISPINVAANDFESDLIT